MNGAPDFRSPTNGQQPELNPGDTRIPPPQRDGQQPQGVQQYQQYFEQDAQQRQRQWQQGGEHRQREQQHWQQGQYAQGQHHPGQHQQPYPLQYPPQRRGVAPWAWGALAYIPIPFFNVPIAGIAQWRIGLNERKYGGLAEVNGRRAANWGLTQLLWFGVFAAVVGAIMALTLGGAFGPANPGGSYTLPGWVEAIMFTAIGSYMLVGVLQFVYLIVGLMKSLGGKEVKLPVIPFIKG